jgi:CRISPR-associated protein Csb2
VRAGRLGVLELTLDKHKDDKVFGASRVWESSTTYRPTRHPHRSDVRDALIADLRTECSRRGLPLPVVWILQVIEGPKGGLQCRARLTFSKVVGGPIVLGRGSHFGDGLFGAVGATAE